MRLRAKGLRNGFVEPRFAGMAPGVRNIHFANLLDSKRLWGCALSVGPSWPHALDAGVGIAREAN